MRLPDNLERFRSPTREVMSRLIWLPCLWNRGMGGNRRLHLGRNVVQTPTCALDRREGLLAVTMSL